MVLNCSGKNSTGPGKAALYSLLARCLACATLTDRGDCTALGHLPLSSAHCAVSLRPLGRPPAAQSGPIADNSLDIALVLLQICLHQFWNPPTLLLYNIPADMAAPPVPPRPFDEYDSPHRQDSAPPSVPPLPPDFKPDQYSSGPHFEDPLVAPRPHKLQPDLPKNVRTISPSISSIPFIRFFLFHSPRWHKASTSKRPCLPSSHLRSQTPLFHNPPSPVASSLHLPQTTTPSDLPLPKAAPCRAARALYPRLKALIGLLGLPLRLSSSRCRPSPSRWALQVLLLPSINTTSLSPALLLT